MIVGNNERLYPWMDEGFNTFINHYSTMAFNNGEYFDPKGFVISNMRNPQLQAFVVKGANREAIATYPDIVQDRNLGVTAYYKPGAGMWLLREYILGPERFDFAFRSYIKAWAFKHPQPADFFNFMNNAAGDELAWFWKAWFYGTGTIDQSVANVSYVKDDPKNGSLILVKNNGDVMPVVLEVTEENGKKTRLNLPVEIWQKTNNKVIRVNTTSRVIKAEIDPDKVLPDVDGSNDVWSAEAEAKKKAIEEENKRKEEEAKKKAEEEAKKKAEEEEGKGKKKKKKKGE
jgi:aminopeptidase N